MKEHSLNYIYLAGLLAAFFIISLLIYMNRGKSGYLISKKLKLGALILTISGGLVCGGCTQSINCYAPLPDANEISIDSGFVDGKLLLPENGTFTGKIFFRQSSAFSFTIADTLAEIEYQAEEIAASDGDFDEETEEFSIKISDTLISGEYILNLYKSGLENKNANTLSRSYRLIIKK